MKIFKKIICLALCSIILLASSFNVNAKSGVAMQLVEETVEAGGYVVINVLFTAEKEMNAFYYELNYDTASLEFVSTTADSVNSNTAGTIIYIADANASSVSDVYKFKCKKPGSTTINVSNVISADLEEYTYPDASYSFTVNRATVGDANDDGVVNTSDLAQLKLYLAGTGATIHSQYSDLNKDEKIDTSDLALLKLRLAGA